jgi:hypothetical protein
MNVVGQGHGIPTRLFFPGEEGSAGALERLALRVREHCLRLTAGGGCFIGASLSCADLLVHLYSRVLNIGPDTLDDPGRDYMRLVSNIRDIERSLGDGVKRVYAGELPQIEKLRRVKTAFAATA